MKKTKWWKAYAVAALWGIEALAHAAGAPSWLVWLGAVMTPVTTWAIPNPEKDSPETLR